MVLTHPQSTMHIRVYCISSMYISFHHRRQSMSSMIYLWCDIYDIYPCCLFQIILLFQIIFLSLMWTKTAPRRMSTMTFPQKTEGDRFVFSSMALPSYSFQRWLPHFTFSSMRISPKSSKVIAALPWCQPSFTIFRYIPIRTQQLTGSWFLKRYVSWYSFTADSTSPWVLPGRI